MSKKVRSSLGLAFGLLLLLLQSCVSEKKEVLRIACAANMSLCAQELIDSMNKDSNIQIELIIGSSGKLFSQILHGAPFHLFISADTGYTNRLHKEGLGEKPKTYGFGRLVLWTYHEAIDLNTIDLSNKGIKKIAIANPQVAPYGKLSINYLSNIGIFDKIEQKLIYGESISQVNQYVISQSVDVGITSLSSIYHNIEVKGNYIVINDLESNTLAHSAQVLTYGNNKKGASYFINFMLSEKGKEILRKYGYFTP